MESSATDSSTGSVKIDAFNHEMDSSNENIDLQVLRDAGEQSIDAEWSATTSVLHSSDATSNTYVNIETLKECCANPSDTLKDKEDFMVLESSTVENISKFDANDTQYSEFKTTAFQKKLKPLDYNVSRCFENILDNDSQMEITQNSICLNRFQKRKRLMPPNDEDFIEIYNSSHSGSNSVEVSMIKSPKFCFSRKKKDQFEIPDYNLSATDSDSVAGDTNISNRTNTSNFSLVVNDSSNNMKNVSKIEVFTKKFNLKSIGVVDSAFENSINNSSIISDITLNNKKTSLNETALSNVSNISVFSKMNLSNLNHTYDIPNNTNSTLVKAPIAGDAYTPKVKKNTVFKKPSNLSILVNDSSNNIMDASKTEIFTSDSVAGDTNISKRTNTSNFSLVNDSSNMKNVSKTEVFTKKFSRKSLDVPDSTFDNIIDDSSMTSDSALNNKKSSSNETSVSNINNSKMDMSNLNYTYDIPMHINTSSIDVCIADDANVPSLKQNTVFQKVSNSSILVNDISNNIMDVSKTEVFTRKFSRKTIDVTHSVFENIINDSSITSDITVSDKNTNSTETPVSNVNNSVLNKINMSNLNHTYDIPTMMNVSIAGDANTPKVKQNTDFKKSTNSSFVINDDLNNIVDVSKTEVFTRKFSRKKIDVTHSVFENIINDSSITSDITVSDKSTNSTETPVSNVNNTPVFVTMDVSNLNQMCDVRMNNKTTLLDATVEHDKSMFETLDLLQNNRSQSLNLLPLKFNFSKRFGRHSLSLQENCPNLDGVKKHNISLNTDFSKNDRKESTPFHKFFNNSNANLMSYQHISTIQENDNSSKEIQLNSKRSICSNSNDEDLSNTTTRLLENNEFPKTQPKHSTSSISSDEGLILLNSTTGLLGSCSSSRTQSRLLTSKQSNISTSNNNTLNLSIESLDSNKSQDDQSKHPISSTLSNESLTLINQTAGFSGTRSSSRNKSTLSKHSTSVISNNDSLLMSLNATTEISVGGRSSRTQSRNSTSATSNNDGLTLVNTTVGSLKSNESKDMQSKCSISPTSYDESLKSTNSTTGFSGTRSSSRNESTLSKHSTSVISNNDSLMSLNATTEISVGGRSSRTQSRNSTSATSNNDGLTLVNTTVGSLKSNESKDMQSKCSISPTSYDESLKSTNSTTGFSGTRSSSRNESTLSKHSTSVISNNDSLMSLNATTEISVGGRSSRTQSRNSTSATSNNDGLTLVNTTVGSLKSNESKDMQSKCSISPTSYDESLKSTNSTTGVSGRRSSFRNKTSSKHSTSVISNNDSLTLLNAATEMSVGSRLLRNQSKHSTSIIENGNSLILLNASMESLKTNESPKPQSKCSISPTSHDESLKSTNSTTGISVKRSSRNKSFSTSSKHLTDVIPNNESSILLNAASGISGSGRLSRNKSSILSSKHSTSAVSNNGSLTSLNTTVRSLKRNESQNMQSKRSISPTSYNESIKSMNSTTGFTGKHNSSRNKSFKHSTSVISNNDNLPLFTMGSSESNKSPKTESTSPTLNIENLTTLNTNSGSLRQNELSINRSTSKHSSPIISGKTLILEDVINNVSSRMSTRLSKQKSNISATSGLILDDDANNVSMMNASSSKLKKKSYDNKQMMQDITDGPLVESRPFTTRVLRSSMCTNKNKSLKSDNNVNNLSIRTTRTSNNTANFGNDSDNSLFWTTLPDESTNISNTQNVNMNTFQTPERNKLSIAENIANTIKIMSTNKKKSTHPGVFELDDHNNEPLTKSILTRSHNRSPSILTLVFGGQKPSESTLSLTQSPSKIIFDHTQVEKNVEQKFKALYKKESWITKRLYKFLIMKFEPNYNIYSVMYAEKFVKYLARLFKQIDNNQVNLQLGTDMLRYHMARYHIIKNTFDYLGFLTDYIPMQYYKKLVPGWNLETSAVKFDPQKYYIPLVDDEEFLNYIMEHLNKD